MSTTFDFARGSRDGLPPEDEVLRYRSLSPLAVLSLILGVLSVVAWLDPALGFVPILGVVTGIIAWVRIKRAPNDFAGLGFARAGIVISVLLATTGWSWLAYSYATEVPDGYQRISYDLLQPPADSPPDDVPPSATALNGKQVFVKGYVYPGAYESDAEGITKFVLVRDNGQCCFGGQPKITDMIHVTLTGGLHLKYSPRMHHVAGTFQVAPSKAGELGGVVYQMTADYLR
ncbi:MAG: DUF4190 domain-containing protein [Pirellulales bacterium]|nr:DUF4190 domain-containing protein [Pirellulales bacterium]